MKPKWVVYWEPNDSEPEVAWFQNVSDAKDKIGELIEECGEKSVEAEKNLHWYITLLKVKGEVQDSPDGMRLR